MPRTRSTLNLEKAREIRRRYSEEEVTQKVLAEEYDVDTTTISLIIRNKRWKEVG